MAAPRRRLSPARVARLKRTLDTGAAKYKKLVAQSKSVRRMSPSQFRNFTRDASRLYAAVARMKNTGTADCLDSCESEYSKCQRSHSERVCRLQASKCLIKCGYSYTGGGSLI